MKLYVGNLSFDCSDQDLHGAFAKFGEVASAQVVTDRETGRSRGFGFVEMPDANQAKAAITGLDGKDMMGRALRVSEARAREDGPRRPRY